MGIFKCQIRSDTIVYSGQKAKHMRQRERELTAKLEYLEKNLDNNECNYVTETSEPNEILQEQVGFYADLYSCKCKEDSYTELQKLFLNNRSIPKLDMEAKQLCNEPLSLLEISNALKEMALDKSPGPDGPTTNFYKCFWDDLKQPLLDSYLFAFKHSELADGQRRGILNLIPKRDKDLRYLKSWCPVSLLATDYKILAKALAIRLQKAI